MIAGNRCMRHWSSTGGIGVARTAAIRTAQTLIPIYGNGEPCKMLFADSYADNSPCELGALAAGVLYFAAWCAFECACAHVCYGLGIEIDCPAESALFGAFGIPILSVLVNGWRAR